MRHVSAYMCRVDYRVLGALQAGPDPTVLRGQRGRDVLALLLTRRGRPLSPELILDAVWENDAVRLDASVVHTVIARLRRALGHEAITRHDTGYQLAPEACVDADEFTRLVTQARALVPERHGEIVDLLRQALALWTGPEAYAGVSESLVATDRPRLHELRDIATEQLAERLLADGSPDAAADAILLATELTAREPLRERAHELLMEGLYRAGRQAEALSAYDGLRRALRDELGIDPSPTTSALYARILAQDIAIRPAVRSPGSSRSAAPRPRTPTIGRERELQTLAEHDASGRRLVTLVGPGGVGKSHLLTEYAARLPDGTSRLYVELPCIGGATAAEVAESIARAAGQTLGGGDPIDTLASALRASDYLLLLDEAEWSVGACAEVVQRLITSCPGIRFVVTSRVPLDLIGESRLIVGPLPAPAVGAGSAELVGSPAVRLFVDRLADYAPDLQLSADDYERAAEITRRTDGLPLALEIVAGQAVSSSVADLLALVESPLDLESGDRDREDRQRSLRETLTWSMERLSTPAQAVLARLGVFAGSFDMAAAEAVVGHVPASPDGLGALDVPAVIRTLIREAQLQVDRRDGRLRMRMLRTVQGLARERLAAEGETSVTMQRYRSWYAARWRDQPLSDELVVDVGTSYADYVAALRSALAAHDPETQGDLTITLSRYWFFVETGSEGIRFVRAALATGVLSERHTAILRLLEAALLPQDQGVEQRRALDELVPLLANDPDWLGRLHILRSVGPYVHGDFSRALRCAGEGVVIARGRAGHHLPEALGAYAVMLAAVGRTAEAVSASEEAWRLIAARPSAIDLTQVVPKVALALMDSDHPREALDILDRALDRVSQQIGLAPTSLFTINAGWAALGCGEPTIALERFARSLDHLAGGGDLLVTGEVLSGASAALAALGAPGAHEVAALAQEHLRAGAAVLSPWQARIVARHLDLLPEGATAPVLAALDFEHGAALIRAAADQRQCD